ncbi:MAG: hypothetical protein ABI616_15680 [Pseudomonadota bacterium]
MEGIAAPLLRAISIGGTLCVGGKEVMTVLEGTIAWLLGMLSLAAVAWAVRAAKRGGKAINVVGAAMTLVTLGNVQDPNNEAILTAQEPRKKESGDNGDPPDDQD